MAHLNTDTPEIEVGQLPEGTTTINDKLSFEPHRLSYETADEIASEIAGTLESSIEGKTVVVADLDLFSAFSNLVATEMVLHSLKNSYEGVSNLAQILAQKKTAIHKRTIPAIAMTAAFPPVAMIATGIQAAIGLVRFFREDVDYRGVDISIDPLTFSLAFAGQLKKFGADKVFVPAVFVLQPMDLDSSELVKALDDVQKAQGAAWQTFGPWVTKLSRLNADLDAAVAAGNQGAVDQLSSSLAALRREMDPINEALERADRTLAQLQEEWQKPAPQGGFTVLAGLLRAEALKQLKPLLIHAQVVASGGHHRISHSAWRSMFQGDGVSAMGGAVARWALLSSDGSIQTGGILTRRRRENFPKTSD